MRSNLLTALLTLTLLGCLGAEGQESVFGEPQPTDGDAAVLVPPVIGGDAAVVDGVPSDLPAVDAATAVDTGPKPPIDAATLMCPSRTDGRANICVYVTKGSEAPTPNANLGLDGKGGLTIYLATADKLDGTIVTKSYLPTGSTAASRFYINELPKLSEPMVVAPGQYYAFGIFHDADPIDRSETQLGDYVNRPIDLSKAKVEANQGLVVQLRIYPVRGIDVTLWTKEPTPPNDGVGFVRAWAYGSFGEVRALSPLTCRQIADRPTMRMLSPFVGPLDVSAGLFTSSPFDLPPPNESPVGALLGVSQLYVSEQSWLTQADLELNVATVPSTDPVSCKP